jgi:prepilin-type N-terminal cleavage/methylation domain-containing protein
MTGSARGNLRSRGFTLVEVVAAVVVLGTVLALIVVARTRYTKQLLVADQRTKAAAALDDLIAGWMKSDAPRVPLNGGGRLVVDRYPMEWSTRLLNTSGPFETRLVRADVRIIPQWSDRRRKADEAPLLVVDLVIPGIAGPTAMSGAAVPVDVNAQPTNVPPPDAAPATQPTDVVADPRLQQGVP